MPKLTNIEIDEIIRRHNTGEGYRRLAKAFGVSRSTIRHHVTGRHARAMLALSQREDTKCR